MTKTDFLCLAPLMIIAAAPVVIMLAVTVKRNFRFTYLFSLAMFLAAFISLFWVMPEAPHYFSPLFVIDGYGILFLGIIFLAAIMITVLSHEYLKNQSGEREEYFIILFVGVLGSSVLVIAEHFVSFFLGLETLSISLYILIAYLKWRDECIEAGVKYLVMASLATAFLLFGMGLIYAETGTMNFREIFQDGQVQSVQPLMLAGAGLVFAGIGFKLALVPFHMWTPDVYQGAPLPVTTFIATISKAAILALALRLFIDIQGNDNSILMTVISAVSIISMFTGNLLALKQISLKRLLAYSSIAHMGYLLITLAAGTPEAEKAAVFYLATYLITSIAAFGVISVLSAGERDMDRIDDFNGLFWDHPLPASALALAMLSLAGLPLTAGFISKFYLVLAGVKSGLWLLAFSLIINTVISLYYYLRVIKALFSASLYTEKHRLSFNINILMILLISGILFLGILPSYVTELIGRFLQ